MKKLLFSLLLFALPLMAQDIPIIGDTTDLKAHSVKQMVILQQFGGGDETGGGLFRRVDSSFAEGTHAFDYTALNGLQWVRMQYMGGEMGAFSELTATTGTITTATITNMAGNAALDSAVWAGQDAFTTTAAADTVVISGAVATDLYFVTPISETIDAQDVTLQVNAKADTLIVVRPASGASGLGYNWLRVKTY